MKKSMMLEEIKSLEHKIYHLNGVVSHLEKVVAELENQRRANKKMYAEVKSTRHATLVKAKKIWETRFATGWSFDQIGIEHGISGNQAQKLFVLSAFDRAMTAL